MTRAIERRTIKEKAFSYITRDNQLLVFRHAHYPEVGIQVPGGSVASGEEPSATATREAQEETGLSQLRMVAYLGQQAHDMRPIKDEIQVRHFYHLACDASPPARWAHFETHPDQSGNPEPVKFDFFWVPLDGTDAGLVTAQGALLSRISSAAVAKAKRPLHQRSFVADLAETIAAFRHRKAGEIARTLDKLSPGSGAEWVASGERPLLYAVQHHLFYSLLNASASNDATRAKQLISAAAGRALALRSRQPPLVLRQDACKLFRDPKFDSGLHVYQPDVASPEEGALTSRLQSALSLLRRHGFGELIDRYLGVIVVMEQRARTEPTKSFTVSALPGTIFMDDVDDIPRLAELVVHESSHCWLNDALAALGERASLNGQFWSPWKQTMRPAYGIIQGAFAFSQMMQLFADLLDDPQHSPFTVTYCSQRLVADAAALRLALPQLAEVLAMVKNPLLRGLILDECNRALQHPQVEGLDPS